MSNPNANDLFIQDRMARDSVDYEGSGRGGNFFDEKEERRRKFISIRAYIVFICICMVLIGITTFLLAADIKLMTTAHSVVGEYQEGSLQAYVTDEKNMQHMIMFDSLAARKNGRITLYYYDDVSSAMAVTSIWFYVIMYITWGVFSAVLIMLAWRTWHKSHHAVERTGKSRFDD